jgi:DNA-binding NtrC family response regulator
MDRTKPRLAASAPRRARMRPFLFLAFEAGRPTGGSGRFALDTIDSIEIGRGSIRSVERSPDGRCKRLTVPDPWMSRAHARVVRRDDGFVVVDQGSSNGSFLDGREVSTGAIHDGALLELGHTFFVIRRLPAGDDVHDILDGSDARAGLATVLPDLEDRLADLVRVASSGVSIVLRGPSGAGKDVLARVLHQISGRAGPLVAVNCGAIPHDLVESELFGHRRGAFSGASGDKVGLVAAADRGTLFLDEIGDLPAAAQPALLRTLQDRAVVPIGATAPTSVDFRVISATHRDLDAMVAAHRFREDLWGRLNGMSFTLPALAERREDLGTLVAQICDRVSPDQDVTILPDAARAIVRYAWPRNVRELEKALEAAIARTAGADIDVHHLPPEVGDGALRSGVYSLPSEDDVEPVQPSAIDDPRRAALVAALREHGGNVSAAARALGKPRSQVQRWMRRWGVGADGAEP